MTPGANNNVFLFRALKNAVNIEAKNKRKALLMLLSALLPDLDSNQDKQSQSLSYYRYTIGHS